MSTLKTCSNCRFWSGTSGYRGYGECGKITLKGHDYNIEDDEVDLGGLPAFTEDGSDYRADLFTLGTFGCTMYEDKIVIPSQQENPRGLHTRYQVCKADGSPCDANALYFVMRYDHMGSDPAHIRACQEGLLKYCEGIEKYLPELAKELRAKVLVEQALLL